MGNIIGDGFPQVIINQVEKRQEIYGSKTRNNEVQTFLNSKTGWVRLGSSVNVKKYNSSRNLELMENELAKQYVLFNGVSTFNSETPTQRSGITNVNSINSNFAYGIGGTDQGIVPMPGIISMSTKTETRGSLKTSTIQIKCHNKIQFDIIDTLYLRLGFTMLLEWGNSSYYDNDGELIERNPWNLMDDFLENKISYTDFYPQIELRRLKSYGNYDAVLGKVVNFNWTFNKDGSYDVTVILRSMGDVIESLKTNVLLPDNYVPPEKNESILEKELKKAVEEDENSPTQVPSDGIFESFVRFLSLKDPKKIALQEAKAKRKKNIRNLENQIEQLGELKTNEEAEGRGSVFANRNSSTLGRFIYDSLQSFEKSQGAIDGDQFNNGTTFIENNGLRTFIRQTYANEVPPHYFINFGYLLEFIESDIIPNINNKEKLVNIDTDVDSNIIILGGEQYPTDNGVCQVSFVKKFITESGDDTNYYYLGSNTPKFEILKNNSRYGKIMNIYFNVNFVLQCMEKTISDGKSTIIDFLTALCSGWNSSTGNYSKLVPTILEETNTLRIIDENKLPDRDVFLKEQGLSTQLAKFNIYGYQTSENQLKDAGFVTDFSFQTSITPNLATMITIGANSNGSIVGEDATGISRMNNGFKDRIKPEVTSPGTGKTIDLNKPQTNDEDESKKAEQFEEALAFVSQTLQDLGSANNTSKPTYNPDSVSPFKNAIRTIIQYDQSQKTLSKNNEEIEKSNKDNNPTSSNPNNYATASTGFLPFSLSLTLDGLSGIKIYNKFTVDSSFLPSNYPNSLEFLVSGIENSIVGNKWETKLESIATPLNSFSPKSQRVLKAKDKTAPSGQRGESGVYRDKTITSGFALNPRGHNARKFNKTQILLHYTAGSQKQDKGKSTIDSLNTRGLSYHYIIDANGHVEQLIDETYRAYHAGGTGNTKISANTNSIGISLQNYGWGKDENTSSYGKMSAGQTRNVRLIDFNKKPKPYKGQTWGQEITDAQLTALKNLYKEIVSRNPGIGQFKWNQDTFNTIFPSKGFGYAVDKPGYYSHNSNNLGKYDALPTPKLVAFFESLGSSISKEFFTELNNNDAKSLIEDFQKIFTIKDDFGRNFDYASVEFNQISEDLKQRKAKGNLYPLFSPAKGDNDDSEKGAKNIFEAWLKLPEQANRIAKVAPDSDLSNFHESLKELIDEMDDTFAGRVTFKINDKNYFIQSDF